ncbi:PA1414 family protein [Pseudomonas benzenivorans]|nr:PA1414 family protein [Pseudomonas benzenivorans]
MIAKLLNALEDLLVAWGLLERPQPVPIPSSPPRSPQAPRKRR